MRAARAAVSAAFSSREKARLYRNAVILLVFIAVTAAFPAYLTVFTDASPGLKIASCVLCLLMAVPAFMYFLKYVRDLRQGEADVYVGIVSAKRESSNGDAPASHYITVGTLEHQVGFSSYHKVRVGDSVVIRKAPKSSFVVSVIREHARR